MKVVDDALPQVISDLVHETCIELNNWQYLPDTALYKGHQGQRVSYDSSGLGCSILATGPKGEQFNKELYCRFESALMILGEIAGLNTKDDLVRARLGLYLPVPGPEHNTPHRDQEYPHTVLLYYVNDSDGDTFFFDNKKKIKDRVTPKQNRLVIFDGSTRHASSNPSHGYRISLNLNYKKS